MRFFESHKTNAATEQQSDDDDDGWYTNGQKKNWTKANCKLLSYCLPFVVNVVVVVVAIVVVGAILFVVVVILEVVFVVVVVNVGVDVIAANVNHN